MRRRRFVAEQRFVSCTNALKRCLRHAACRKLWHLFIEQCPVENFQCRMKDRKSCGDAFEGIRWTDLPNCGCLDDHRLHGPECHWIELMTSHNRCIDELKQAGLIDNGNGDLADINLNDLWNFSHGENFSMENFGTVITTVLSEDISSTASSKSVSTNDLPSTAGNTRDKLTTGHSTDISFSTTSEAVKVTSTPSKPKSKSAVQLSTMSVRVSSDIVRWASPTTVPPKGTAFDVRLTGRFPVTVVPRSKLIGSGRVYLPLRMNTFPKPLSETEVKSSSGIVYRVGSTCQAAWEHCSMDKVCSWHLSEIQINCNDNIGCSHKSCSPSLRRFTQYVNQTLHEHMLFCTCTTNDEPCLRLQGKVIWQVFTSLPQDMGEKVFSKLSLGSFDEAMQRQLCRLSHSVNEYQRNSVGIRLLLSVWGRKLPKYAGKPLLPKPLFR
ncbi:unnamed protein product [Soboliphyme baturini]|uniref:GDNF domain-containing protein n=1 Tax=Soboliphyme baturini TaxID=241478 RepID=A0A183IPI3_9BILA|nr:unnamed protein product [Soboliphyme baturini]